MRLARRIGLAVVLLLFVISCAGTPKGRYYENLDMYDFVMTKFRTTYEASPVAEQHQMDREVMPLLQAWSNARDIWADSMNDATRERAVMLAWSQARQALVTYGIVTIEEVQ
jgi:hypothetical protein